MFAGREEMHLSFDHFFINETDGKINMKYYNRLAIGLYYFHLKRWKKYFPWSQIEVVDGLRFKSHNPAPILNKLEQFLNVPNFIKKEYFIRGKKGFFCLNIKKGCMGSSKGRKHPVVSETTKEVLRQFYHLENIKFSKYINRSMSWKY